MHSKGDERHGPAARRQSKGMDGRRDDTRCNGKDLLREERHWLGIAPLRSAQAKHREAARGHGEERESTAWALGRNTTRSGGKAGMGNAKAWQSEARHRIGRPWQSGDQRRRGRASLPIAMAKLGIATRGKGRAARSEASAMSGYDMRRNGVARQGKARRRGAEARRRGAGHGQASATAPL